MSYASWLLTVRSQKQQLDTAAEMLSMTRLITTEVRSQCMRSLFSCKSKKRPWQKCCCH